MRLGHTTVGLLTLMRLLRMAFDERSYLVSSGYVASLAKRAEPPAEGTSLPWYSYPARDLLVERIHDSMSVLEFGAGRSTVFYARRARSVTALEHDADWLRRVAAAVPESVRLVQCDATSSESYLAALSGLGQFDLICVDGRHRSACVPAGARHLTAGGVLLLDDSQRERYRASATELVRSGFRELQLEGLRDGSSLASRW